jgi:SAM-dependent methyltransferase
MSARGTPDKSDVAADWLGRAPYWDKWADRIADLADRFNAPLLDALELAPGQRVLDLASGTGEPALSAAARVAPAGHVTATDLVPAMLDGARRRASARGLANIAFEGADMEALPFPDANFDRVTCRFGIMFVPDPVRAMREARRVLVPQGRIGLMAWGPIEETTIMAIVRDAGDAVLGPRANGQALLPFRMGNEGALASPLAAAGFAKIDERAIRFAPEIDASTPFWRPMVEMTLGARLLGIAEETRTRLETDIHQRLEPYRAEGVYRLKVHVRLATATA